MKSQKLLLVTAITAGCLGTLVGCGGNNKIVIWVGEESQAFYQKACNKFKEENKDFKWEIVVKGMDTGAAAGTITTDKKAAADIYTVAHDNIGKLAAGNYAKPIVNEELTNQILANNPDSFKKVIYSSLNGKDFLFAAPYISQALFLYYNKTLVTEEQSKSFEGLMEAAEAAGTKAWTVTGTDGYNNSFGILARKVTDKSTTVKIYEGATSELRGTSNVQGDDTIAIVRYLQRALKNPNGLKWASSDGWEADMKNKGVLSVIGGAWHYNSAASSVGENNLGMTIIPTMKLTNADVEGLTSVAAGDEYRGGSFADCKVFMINSASAAEKYEDEQTLLKYLTSKEVQNESFMECSNVPAYVGAADYIKTLFEGGKIKENQYKLAASQVSMAEWGIPQPFITGTLNTYYYSKNAFDIYKAVIDQSKYPTTGDVLLSETSSLDGIRKALYEMEYIWMHGKTVQANDLPASLPTKA